jgi:geranylgeranyl transferase type-1 subunit beta
MSAATSSIQFDRILHVAYFAANLRQMPAPYANADTNRLTMAHFCVHALDMLGVWEDASLQQQFGLNAAAIIEWIYSLQVSTDDGVGGFLGGTFVGIPPPADYAHGHIAMTYTALATLRTLGDDLSRVDREGIGKALEQAWHRPEGSFQAVAVGSEYDMRFLYCACCISHILNDWSGVDVEKAADYIQSCQSWDGAFALLPGQEGHGGSTFCATASLVLMNKLDEVLDQQSRKELIRWCCGRQVAGMQGRPNKAEDTCYSYWIGATMRLLGHDDLLDHQQLRGFVMQCQTKMGGFSKVIGAYPDILHAFYSTAYLSLSQRHFTDDDEQHGIQLKDLNCTLGICQERAALFRPLFP